MSNAEDEAMHYLLTGGLGEVIDLASIALKYRRPRVEMDTDMAMALCLLASEAADARRKRETN